MKALEGIKKSQEYQAILEFLKKYFEIWIDYVEKELKDR